MDRKYSTTPEDGMLRIVALRDFDGIRTGDIGGLIESESNLLHDGNAWVWDNAQVCENAQVCGNAIVGDNAIVWDNAQVSGNARVGGNAIVWDNAIVSDNAQVSGDARVGGNARVSGNIFVRGYARVGGSARISRSEHVLTIDPTQFGALTIYRTELGHGILVGCQNFILDGMSAVASEFDADPLTLLMLPHLKAMLSILVASWHEKTGD